MFVGINIQSSRNKSRKWYNLQEYRNRKRKT